MASIEKLLSIQTKHGLIDDGEEEEEAGGYPLGKHPTITPSDDEDELDDNSQHTKLLAAITSMDSKKKSKVKQRSEPTAEVSEFQMNTKDAQGKGVWIHDLMGVLRNTPSHSALKKQMNTINKRKLIATPLHKHEADKIQRQMAYETTSKDVSKWDHVVHTNRRAENLSFPLNQQVLGLPTTDQFVKKFKPSTPLEQEVYKILHGSKYAERPNKKLTQAEEEALKAMSLSEAKERRAELQKHRALVSFFEAKCRRQKKIKSKKYHRIQRKSKARLESKKIEEMMQTDPEAAQETLDKLEKSRATERMSLKHRNTGKWAKTMMRYGRHNISARKELAQQLHKSHELTEKVAEVTEDKREEVEESGGEEDEGGAKPSLSDINNPWFTGGKAGKDKDEDAEEDAGGEKEGYVALEAVQVARGDGDDEEEEGEDGVEETELDEDHKVLKMIQEERRKWEGGDALDESEEDGDDSDQEEEKLTDSKASRKVKKSAKDKRTSPKKKGKKKKRIIEVVDEDEDCNHGDEKEDEALDEGLERRQTHSSLEDQAWLNRLEEEKARSDEIQPTQTVVSEAKEKATKSKKSSSNVDPSKVFTVKSKEIRSLEPELVEEEDAEEEDDREKKRRQQRMNIQQAFADDDVVEEFKEEKKAKVEKDKPKDIDLTIPGWGDWGGMGVQPSKKKRKRFVIKAPPKPPRRDARLPHVIINENRDKKIAMHQVNNLPFPFSNTNEFERSIRAPIGSTWNTPSAVKALTLPKVTTKTGAIIEPIKAEETFKGRNKKQKQGNQQQGKRKGPRPDIVFDDDDDDGQQKRRKGKGNRK